MNGRVRSLSAIFRPKCVWNLHFILAVCPFTTCCLCYDGLPTLWQNQQICFFFLFFNRMIGCKQARICTELLTVLKLSMNFFVSMIFECLENVFWPVWVDPFGPSSAWLWHNPFCCSFLERSECMIESTRVFRQKIVTLKFAYRGFCTSESFWEKQ